MDSLFHFVLPILASLAARLNLKHPTKTIILAAFLSVLIDIDHFGYNTFFHNIFVALIIPLILLYLSFHFKLDKYKKGFFLLLLIFLSGHLMLDLFSSPIFGNGIGIIKGSGINLFYPLSNQRYSIDFSVTIPIPDANGVKTLDGYIITSLGFGMMLYLVLIIVPCLFIDDIIEISERKHKNFMKAAKIFFKKSLKD